MTDVINPKRASPDQLLPYHKKISAEGKAQMICFISYTYMVLKRTSYFLDDRISFLQFFLHFHNPYSCAERSFSDIKNTSHCLHHYALCSSRRFASANAREISRFIQCGNSLHAVSSSVIQTNPSCSRLKQTSPCFQ